MKPKVEQITPEKANKLLANSTKNRPLSQKRIRYYANLMSDGKWMPTHQGIAISKKGVLLDGHHRLWAVVKSDATVDMVVVYDLDEESFKYMDVGYTRTTANIFAIEGISYFSVHAAGIGRYLNFKKNNNLSENKNRNTRFEMVHTHDDYLKFYYEHEDFLNDVAKISVAYYQKYKIISQSELYGFYLIAHLDYGWPFEIVTAFFDNVYMIRHDSKSSTPKQLFEKLVQNATGSLELKPSAKTALIIKAFKYYVKGKSVRGLRYQDGTDKYPTMPVCFAPRTNSNLLLQF